MRSAKFILAILLFFHSHILSVPRCHRLYMGCSFFSFPFLSDLSSRAWTHHTTLASASLFSGSQWTTLIRLSTGSIHLPLIAAPSAVDSDPSLRCS